MLIQMFLCNSCDLQYLIFMPQYNDSKRKCNALVPDQHVSQSVHLIRLLIIRRLIQTLVQCSFSDLKPGFNAIVFVFATSTAMFL